MSIELLLTLFVLGVIGFCLGYYSRDILDRGSDVLKKMSGVPKTPKNHIKTGPIDYVTPEQSAYYGSDEERADNDRNRAASAAGLKMDDDL